MTRNFKALGLALVAVFAMSAMAASGASASSFTAAEYPVHIQGADTSEGSSKFTSIAPTITCNTATYTNTDPLTIESPYFEPEASESLTISPTYENCKSGSREVTVTMNGCDYVFTTQAEGQALTSDLVCPAGKTVTIEIYNSGAHIDSNLWCNIHIGGQSNLEGLTADTSGNNVRATGAVEKISATVTPGSCSFGLHLTINTSLDTDATLEGKNEAGGGVKIDVG